MGAAINAPGIGHNVAHHGVLDVVDVQRFHFVHRHHDVCDAQIASLAAFLDRQHWFSLGRRIRVATPMMRCSPTTSGKRAPRANMDRLAPSSWLAKMVAEAWTGVHEVGRRRLNGDVGIERPIHY
jgi:hypothetical protein